MCAAVVLLFSLLFVAAVLILGAGFDQLEREYAEHTADEIREAVEARVEGLDRIAADWAAWDDTYAFLKTGSKDFVDANLSDEAVANLRVDLMLFVRSDGTVVFAKGVDATSGREATPPAELVRRLASERELVAGTDIRRGTTGLLDAAPAPLLVAARPVTTSDFTGSPNGTLIVGRFLDAAELASLDRLSGVKVALLRTDDTGVPADVRARLAKTSGAVELVPVDDSTLHGYTMLPVLGDAGFVMLRASMPRDAHLQGRMTLVYLAVWLALCGVLTAFVTVRILDAMVFKRLERAVEERTGELRESEERHRALLEAMPDAVITFGPDGHITYANWSAERLTGLTRDELLKSRYRDFIEPDSADALAAAHEDHQGDTWKVDAKIRTESGRVIPVELHVTTLAGTEPPVVQWIARDVTERQRFESQLFHLANHDYLTGLFNRRRFEEELRTRLSRVARDGGCGAILWLDIDNFKDVNDTLGHHAGDEVLVRVADYLRQHVRQYNVLARLGGDEFAVMMPEAGEEAALALGRRLLAGISHLTFSHRDRPIHLTVSVGVVLFPQHGNTVEELLARADLAMYSAKNSGHGRLHVHEPDGAWTVEARERLAWGERIVSALQDERMLVYAQPILDLRSGKIRRYELLIRMAEDDHILTPDQFLPPAERLGLMPDIDRFMVERAIALLAAQPDSSVCLDVNLSGSALSDPSLLHFIEDELKLAQVAATRFGVEITETTAVSDIRKAQEFVTRLKTIGCRVSLDDFGSGFSSFYYLKHLPIDALKIDGSFVSGIAGNGQDMHLVRALIELCRALGVESTAEYVEDGETLGLLRELDADYAQGFHVGRPMPVEQVLLPAEGAGAA
jgi:diguanylate cyclase (GGDEF)-like protein/PAS domain S-box-containing protein